MPVPKCLFFQDLEGPTEVFGGTSAGMSGPKLLCWAEFSFLKLGNVSETPTPTTCLKSTAVHLQFVRQYAPHLYRRTFLASKLFEERETLQYAPHFYCSTPPFVRQYAPQ